MLPDAAPSPAPYQIPRRESAGEWSATGLVRATVVAWITPAWPDSEPAPETTSVNSGGRMRISCPEADGVPEGKCSADRRLPRSREKLRGRNARTVPPPVQTPARPELLPPPITGDTFGRPVRRPAASPA